jgi:general secretion pathway protein B
MSYILEALKKIEQKQQREGVPRLLTIPSDLPEEEKKSRVLPYVIVGALVLNAAIMTAWWIAPWQSRQKIVPPAEPPVIQQKTAPAISEIPPAVHAPFTGKYSTEQPTPKFGEKSAQISRRAPEKDSLEATSGQRAKTAPSASQAPEAPLRKETRSALASPGDKLLSLEELPATVRGSLPEFKISGHAYSSEPHFRVARVNNKIVQEGEALSQGLRVDEIVPGGVVFTFQGYRFRVGTNDNK